MSLDSIQAVILYDRFISCEHFLTIHWKQGVDHEAVRIPIRNSREIDNNLSLLERSFVQLGGAPRIERHATIVSPLDRQTRGAAFGLALYAIAATWLAKKMSKVGPLVVFVYLPTASLLFLYVGHWAWLVTVAAFALGRLAKERPTINQMSPSESDRGELGLPRAPA